MNENFKSGFVALVGRPNVGKSTLMNHLIGQKIAITSEKPQTTRNRIQTVYTDKRGQIIFLDTPGIHKAKNKLGQYMVNVAEGTLNEVDVIMWLVEPTTYIGAGEQHIAELLSKVKTPVILAINKIDTLSGMGPLKVCTAYRKSDGTILRDLPATIEEQTRQSLANCKAVLEAAGAAMENVIKTTVFLSDMNNFAAMNGVYATFFEGACPARSAVEVARLPKDALVEIECIAVL